jgi:uncharacterized Zn-finger protein
MQQIADWLEQLGMPEYVRALTCVPNRVGSLICDASKLQLKALTTRSENMTDEVIPHFHNDLGVAVIEIGAKKFMCMGALPPQDHPHVFCDMGEDVEYVCPYCSTLYRHNPALAPSRARPAECEFHDVG